MSDFSDMRETAKRYGDGSVFRGTEVLDLLNALDEAEREIARLTVVGEPHRRSRRRWESLELRLEAAEAAIERVRAVHRVDQYTEGTARVRCVCEESWPCSTVAALAPVTEGGDDGLQED